jgi:predicted  nucleic acid-binding Zn-ribbon protein
MKNQRLKIKLELAIADVQDLVAALINEIDGLEDEVERLEDDLQDANEKIDMMEE